MHIHTATCTPKHTPHRLCGSPASLSLQGVVPTRTPHPREVQMLPALHVAVLLPATPPMTVSGRNPPWGCTYTPGGLLFLFSWGHTRIQRSLLASIQAILPRRGLGAPLEWSAGVLLVNTSTCAQSACVYTGKGCTEIRFKFNWFALQVPLLSCDHLFFVHLNRLVTEYIFSSHCCSITY